MTRPGSPSRGAMIYESESHGFVARFWNEAPSSMDVVKAVTFARAMNQSVAF
jgi:hypothetical protein